MTLCKTHLTLSYQRLLAEMQRINYGRIEQLHVREDQPVMDPAPRIIRDIKFGAENGPRPEAAKGDFTLKAQVCELLAQIGAIGDGVITCIEVQRGLPFRMTIEERHA